MAESRLFQVEGIQNLRDIGGYATRSGQTTRYKRLLRSGNLDKVPAASQDWLLAYGVRHIIDVRDEWEQENYRNVFTEHPGVSYQNLPVVGNGHLKDAESERIMNQAAKRSDVYTFVLEQCQPQLVRVVQAVANLPENECGLIQCVAGKDRTGTAVALILSALDVSAETISREYALSQSISQHLLNQWQSDDDDEEKRHRLMMEASATEETMNETLVWLDKQYGGVAGYLRLDDATMNALRRRLLE